MCAIFMPTWRAVKNCEDFFVLGHVVKKQYLCSVFRKKGIRKSNQKELKEIFVVGRLSA